MKIRIHILKLFFAGVMIWLLSCPEHGIAQQKINPEHYGGDSDSVPVYHYDVIRNRPDSMPKLTFIFYPLIYTINSFGNDVLQVYSSYDLNKKINFYSTASIAFFEEIIPEDPVPAVLIPYFNLEIGENHYFYQKKFSTNTRTYFQTNPGATLSTKFKRDYLIKFGYRGSFGFSNSTVASYTMDFIGYNTSDPQKKKYDFNTSLPSDKYAYTNAQTPYLSIGLTMERIKDIEINIEKFGKREITHKSRIYLDLLASPYAHYDDIVIPEYNTMPQGTYNIDKYTQRQYIGFRVGWNYYSLKKYGIALGAETGIMPNAGGFATLQIGMSLNPKGYIGL